MNTLNHDPNAGPTIVPVMTNAEVAPKKPKVTLWTWICYYAYNLWRKPAVWSAQRELTWIMDDIQKALACEFYPKIENNIATCEPCRDAYMAIRPQVFLSQIEAILRRMKCDTHHHVFNRFLERHGVQFRESEELSAWINGFRR